MSYYNQKESITNKEVIAPKLNALKKLTRNNKLTPRSRSLTTNRYNCWGFTAFAFKWIKEVEWFEFEEMNYCLQNFTKKVKTPKNGDILVLTGAYSNELIHTAIIVDAKEKTVLHKVGGLKLEVNTIKGAKKIYDDSSPRISYHRALPNKKFKYKEFNQNYQWD